MTRTTSGMARAIALLFVMACCSSPQTLKIWAERRSRLRDLDPEGKGGKEHSYWNRDFQRGDPDVDGLSSGTNQGYGNRHHHRPGGAFVALAIDLEGNSVARWLQDKGIAAFVLKYRIMEKRQEGIPAEMNMDEAGKYGIADGIQAIKVVRQHAAEWGISPDRVGFMGFSAGAMVTSGALLQQDAAARPNFAAPIYGGPFGVMPAIPAQTAAHFHGMGAGRRRGPRCGVKFYDALKSAGNKPEAHIFSAGGHGFGMRKQGTSSDHWIDEFYYWLEAHGFAKPPAR